MNNECNIVLDLIPLVQDDAASLESRKFVEEHVAHCEACKTAYEAARCNDQPVSVNDRKNLQQIKKKLYVVFMCIFLTCLVICSLIPLNQTVDFLWNLYFMPLLGAVGALILKKWWFLTPVIVFVISSTAMGIRGGDTGGLFSMQLGFYCALAALAGCLVAVLLRFAVRGGRWK